MIQLVNHHFQALGEQASVLLICQKKMAKCSPNCKRGKHGIHPCPSCKASWRPASDSLAIFWISLFVKEMFEVIWQLSDCWRLQTELPWKMCVFPPVYIMFHQEVSHFNVSTLGCDAQRCCTRMRVCVVFNQETNKSAKDVMMALPKAGTELALLPAGRS